MAFECSKCGRKFVSEDSLAQHINAKHFDSVGEKGKTGFRKYVVYSLIGLIVVFSIAAVYSYSQKPGEYDDFAKCLTEKEVVVYGNDFCSFTGKQLNYFGKSEKYLDYVKCTGNQELCDAKGIRVTPTWEIDGKMHENVQTFDKLSGLTGCEIK
jgi:hypothetical protein